MVDPFGDGLPGQVAGQFGLRDAPRVVGTLGQLSARLWNDPANPDGSESFTGLVTPQAAAATMELVSAYAKRAGTMSLDDAATLAGKLDPKGAADAAGVLVAGILGLASGKGFGRGGYDPLQTLLGIALGPDPLSALARQTILGGVGDGWPPDPGGGDWPGQLPTGGCLEDVLQAGARLGAMIGAARAAEQTIPVADANGITGLSPNGGSSGDLVTINGTFPSPQPTGRVVVFPRAGGGTLQATVLTWTATQIQVAAPEPVGDGPVGFMQVDASIGAGDPTAAIDFADAVGDCLGAVAAGIAGRLSNVPPAGLGVAQPPVPTLPGNVNVFHGGPVLVSAPASGSEIDPPLTVAGLNLRQGDVVVVEGTPAATTFVDASTLQFKVPAIASGNRYLTIGRGYRRSNGSAFEVLATLDPTPPAGRVQPGSMATLKGTGFGPSISATVDGAAAYSIVSGTHSLSVRVFRPAHAPLPSEKRGEAVTVEVFDRGRSLGTVSVLVATIRIASFGDSIVWGQGLLEAEKFTNLTATVVANRKNRAFAVYALDRFANSGATVLPGGASDPSTPKPPGDFTGECPGLGLTISSQVGQWGSRADLSGQTGEIDLVIIDGGINDVGVTTIVNPFLPDGPLVSATLAACGTAFGGLLTTVLTTFPRASVVVTGYYPIVSDQSDLDFLVPVLSAVGALGGLVTPLVAGAVPLGFDPIAAAIFRAWVQRRLVDRTALFASTANTALQTAVTTAVAAFGPRVALAVPAFGPANSIFAPDAFLWGVGLSTSGIVPLDPVAASRIAACGTSFITTIASIGHPNPKGAEAYGAAIEAVLPSVGF